MRHVLNRMSAWTSCLCFFAACSMGPGFLDAAEPTRAAAAGLTPEIQEAMRTFRVAPGLSLDLYAAEPLVKNIVSLTFDEQGRCYVVQSNRRRTSVFDIRNLPAWLENDFAFRTVEDRANFFRETLVPSNSKLADFLKVKPTQLLDYNHDGAVDWKDLLVQSETIQLVVDEDRDGRADAAAPLAEGFDGITSGVAAGVLAQNGRVWFTCIPDLWLLDIPALRQTPGLPDLGTLPLRPDSAKPPATVRNLIHGFGVHIAFGGHDLHGLIQGPDGRIYFSIADRGTSTNLWDRIVDHWPGLTQEALADSGAVFRCEPDGSRLEVVAIGLRNPQELAFDDLGNLFTGDNNGDGGDKARWEHVVEGADYGWRMGWQWLPKMGAWNSERLWGLAGTNTSSYLLPPVAHIGAGPAGVAYYPGTGLSDKFQGHFLMCDFRGGPNSLVHSFALRPRGASFEAYDLAEFVSGFLCTDVTFGTDGAVYVSDWVKGWDKAEAGRIYRISDPKEKESSQVVETRLRLAHGAGSMGIPDLLKELGHLDLRIRMDAQREFVRRFNSEASQRGAIQQGLKATAEGKGPVTRGETPRLSLLRRIHAIQALAEVEVPASGKSTGIGSNDARRSLFIPALIQDPAWEIRVAAWRFAHRSGPGATEKERRDWLSQGFRDADNRVRFEAALASGAWRATNAVTGLMTLLRENADQDPYLRHAASLALARIGDLKALIEASSNPSRSVRMGACLALRRMERPEVARFLSDADPAIVLEAARAIHDVPIPAALETLASFRPKTSGAGQDWDVPLWRRVVQSKVRLGGLSQAQSLVGIATNQALPASIRAAALEGLGSWAQAPARDPIVGLWRPLPSRSPQDAATAMGSSLTVLTEEVDASVRAVAQTAAIHLGLVQAPVAKQAEDESIASLAQILEGGALGARQKALESLARRRDPGAFKLLETWAGRLKLGTVPTGIELDLIQALESNPDMKGKSIVVEALSAREKRRDPKDVLGAWRECLEGGDAAAGRKLFLERQDLACLRCHKLKGEGGEVGPELTGIGSRHPRDYFLESILYPNRQIAAGYESLLVTLKDGSSFAGIVKSETPESLMINSPEDGLITVKKAEVVKRDRGLSPMPEELGTILSKRELRDLVEFLATLRP